MFACPPTWWVRQGSVKDHLASTVYPCAKDRFDAIAETDEGLPQPSLQAFPGCGRFVCCFCRVRCVIMNYDNNHLSHLLGQKASVGNCRHSGRKCFHLAFLMAGTVCAMPLILLMDCRNDNTDGVTRKIPLWIIE